MVRVKICANKRVEDALRAVTFGADAVGFLVGQVHASPDFIDADTAKHIIQKLPPFCSSVLVTHLADAQEIIALAKLINATTIQLHGQSIISDAKHIRESLPYIKVYKAIHVTDESSITKVKEWEGVVDAALLDTVKKSTNQIGGTGEVHDWNISARIVQSTSLPIILAGGLNPENVQEAILQVRPYGVDVNSGTKGADGFKDYKKLQEFIAAAKGM